MNVIAFPTRTRPVDPSVGSCPSWCIDTTGAEHLHAGQPHLFIEHDEQAEPLFAAGVRLASIAGTKPVVEALWWHRNDDGSAIDDRHLLTPDEARSIAEHLLRCAEEAEGATW